MSGKEEVRIFVGGLSWETTERHLEDAFSRFGKVLEAQMDFVRYLWPAGGHFRQVQFIENLITVQNKLYGYAASVSVIHGTDMSGNVKNTTANLVKLAGYKVMLERDTGRPRGFGFVTFADQRAMDRAINEMHGQELGGRVISVNKAQPKVGSDDPGYGYGGGGYSSGSRGGYRGGDDGTPPGGSDCFKCGRPGHFARECPSAGGGGGGRISSRPRFMGGGSGGGGRGDRYGGGDRYGDRYMDDRYDGGRYGDRYGDRYADRDRLDSRYGSGRGDRYGDRYPPADRYSGDRYGGPDRYPQNGYGKERSYDRDGGPRGGGSDRYGSGGPARYEGGSYRERPGPYDRPSRGVRPSSYEDRYP